MMKKYRIKFCYGGRAGGKSYAFADSLLLLGRKKKLLIACLREIQDSIKDSVHKLLSDRIAFYGLNDYKVYEDRIDNLVTGTRFIFKNRTARRSNRWKGLILPGSRKRRRSVKKAGRFWSRQSAKTDRKSGFQ